MVAQATLGAPIASRIRGATHPECPRRAGFRYHLGVTRRHTACVQRFAVLLAAAVVTVAALIFLVPGDQLAPEGLVDLPGSKRLLAASSVLVLALAACLAAQVTSARCSALALLTACGILAAAYAGWAAAWPLFSSVAALVALVAPPAIGALTLVWPDGRFRTPTERSLTMAAWAVAVAAAFVWLLVWSPYADLLCRLTCGANPLSISSQPELARRLFDVVMVATAVGCAVAFAAGWRKERCWAGALAALAVGVDSLLRVVLDQWRAATTLETSYSARTASLGLAGLVLALECSHRLIRRSRFRRMVTTLDAVRPGEYAASLAKALGDRSVRIGYPVGADGAFAQADGRPFTGAKAGQSLTRVVRSSGTVAVIAHRSALAEDVKAGLGPAAELAMDNERLQAELSVRVEALQTSRERIVARADRERVRLERAMHDGAQHMLLMVSHDLTQAVVEDPTLQSELRPVIEDVERVLAESRRIAHGIYPGILEALGLAAALDALADEGASFRLSADEVGRLAAPIERTAYRVVAVAVSHVGPEYGAAIVRVGLNASTLTLEVVSGPDLPMVEQVDLEDRVGALGGTLTLSPARLVCELPCG